MADSEPDGSSIPTDLPGPILVADDDPGVRYVVRWALENEVLPVRLASNGKEALDAGARVSPLM